MKFGLVYNSPNGTTKSVSEVLERIIHKDGYSVKIINLGNPPYRENPEQILKELETMDIVGFGSPVYHMDMLIPMKKLLKAIFNKRDKYNYNFKAFIYLNYSGITSGKAFINTAEVLKQSKIPIVAGLKLVAPHFHYAGEFPKEDTINIIQKFYANIKSKNFKEIEWSRIEQIFSPEKKLVNVLYPLAHIIGKKRELPIKINDEKCRKCQKCITECPVGAISLKSAVKIDYKRCIHCYHCVVVCPFQAVNCPVEKLDKMIRMNKKIMGYENPLNKIYL